MSDLPKVRFLLAWGAYRVGDVVQPRSAMERNRLLGTWYGRRIAELVTQEKPPTPAPEPATVPDLALEQLSTPPSETATVPARKRKRVSS